MADFEDANSPTWHNLVDGQRNLCDAIDGTISFTEPRGEGLSTQRDNGHAHGSAAGTALAGKARAGWTASPCRARCSTSASSFSTTPENCSIRGSGPYFYLPKLESHLEARLWNDVFLMAQDELGIPRGSIRATVLIETIPAAFEMDEILYELREHSAGLNCGRWDYIFSIIKKFCKDPAFTMPDRALVTMTAHCMHSYSLLAIKTCHRRGIHAIGGMAAQIPIKNDPQANAEAMEKVRADKEREAGDGHDGTWVAHPGLVPIAKVSFDAQHAAAQPNRPPPRRRAGHRRRLAARPPGRDQRARAVPEHRRGHPIYGRLAGGQWLRADLQPHGGCRHGGNLPRARFGNGFTNPTASSPTAGRSRRTWSAGCSRNRWINCEENWGRKHFAGGNFDAAEKLIEGIVLKDEFTEFMTLVGYEFLE